MKPMPLARDFDPMTKALLRRADLSDAHDCGEWRLLLAVLDRAIVDVRENKIGIANSARGWIINSDKYEFSFESVCEFLGIESEIARCKILGQVAGEEEYALKLAA